MSEICYFDGQLPTEIMRMIFETLSVTDLLNLCVACRSLNEFIGGSRDYMKKVWVKFYTFNVRDLDALAVSTRSYEKLKVNRVKNGEQSRFIADLQQCWRKVLIYNSEFKEFRFFSELIESFAESIEELEVSDILIHSSDVNICSMKFPNLERVMFRNVPSTAIELFLGSNKKLENASFDIAQPVDGKMPINEILFEFLTNCERLKHLQLGSHYIKGLFDQEVLDTKFSFQLAKLMLRFPLVADPSPDIEINVASFLSNQPNIDWILFFELQSDLVLSTTWNYIPSLSHITFIGLECLFDDAMDFLVEPNERIHTIELITRKVLISQLRKFFIGAPCLKILHVQKLTRFIMEFTARNHCLLQELLYEHIDEDVEELYDSLKVTDDDSINKTIELRQVAFWHQKSNPFSIDPDFWHS